MAYTFNSIEDAQKAWGDDQGNMVNGQETEKQLAAHAYVAEQKAKGSGGETYDDSTGTWTKSSKSSSTSANKPKYTDNTGNIKADQAEEFGAIERMLNDRAGYYTEAQDAILTQQKDAAITALKNSYNRSVQEGKLSVQEAENQFNEQKKVIEQEYYKQAEKTQLFGQEAGIQNSNQILALQSGDWRATQSNVNNNITTRDQRIQAIKDRLNVLREERDANIGLAESGYFNGMKEATATANMATTEALAGLKTADYNAYRDAGLAKDAAAYNTSLQGDLMSYQQDLDIEKLGIGQKYDLEKLAISHGYDLENMSVQQQYDLVKLAAQAATEEKLARIRAADSKSGTQNEALKTFKMLFDWDYSNPTTPAQQKAASEHTLEWWVYNGSEQEAFNKIKRENDLKLEYEGNKKSKGNASFNSSIPGVGE